MPKKEIDKKNVENILTRYAKEDIEKLFSDFNTRLTGLNQIEAEEKLEEVRKEYNRYTK